MGLWECDCATDRASIASRVWLRSQRKLEGNSGIWERKLWICDNNLGVPFLPQQIQNPRIDSHQIYVTFHGRRGNSTKILVFLLQHKFFFGIFDKISFFLSFFNFNFNFLFLCFCFAWYLLCKRICRFPNFPTQFFIF